MGRKFDGGSYPDSLYTIARSNNVIWKTNHRFPAGTTIGGVVPGAPPTVLTNSIASVGTLPNTGETSAGALDQFTATGNETVVLSWTGEWDETVGGPQMDIRVKRNGTTIHTLTLTSKNEKKVTSLTVFDTPPAGDTTYTVTVEVNGDFWTVNETFTVAQIYS